jgi:hypothetical protein
MHKYKPVPTDTTKIHIQEYAQTHIWGDKEKLTLGL